MIRPSPRSLRSALPALGGALLLLAPQAAAAALPQDVRQKVSAADAPAKTLKRESTRQSFGTRFYHFQQRAGGVPVLGAELVVTDAPGDAADMSDDATQSKVDEPPRPTVSRVAAIVAANEEAKGAPLRGATTARLAIQPNADGGRLVWQATVPAGLTNLEVLVDARSGDVVSVRDLRRNATAKARIYDPNPIKQQRSYTGLRGPGADHDDADTARLTNLRVARTLPRLNNSGCLTGKWAHAFIPEVPPEDGFPAQNDDGTYSPLGSGQGRQEVCSPTGDFTGVTRSNDAFEALMAYFHIDRTQRYLQTLGFRKSRGNGLVDRRIEVYVNYQGDDNSYYVAGSDDSPFTPGSRHIVMGIGGVDDGEDAEVFVHEYTHAIQDAASHSFTVSSNDQPFAIGEGGGDYLATSVSERFRKTTGGKVRPGCWSAWDVQKSGSNDPCLRRVDLKFNRPQMAARCDGSNHCLGQVWSGALWQIRSKYGAKVTDRTMLQSMFSYSSGSTFRSVSRAWLKANRRLYKGKHVKYARRVFCKRKFLRKKDCRVKSSRRSGGRRTAPRFTGKQ